MRHVKVKPGLALDRLSLGALITAAYRDIVERLGSLRANPQNRADSDPR